MGQSRPLGLQARLAGLQQGGEPTPALPTPQPGFSRPWLRTAGLGLPAPHHNPTVCSWPPQSLGGLAVQGQCWT